jgi:predicted RNase H-like HicB family nuclease
MSKVPTRKEKSMSFQLTAVFRKVPEGYIGFVQELPGANTQGATLDQTRRNLQEAIALVLEANRRVSEDSMKGQEFIRERLAVVST